MAASREYANFPHLSKPICHQVCIQILHTNYQAHEVSTEMVVVQIHLIFVKRLQFHLMGDTVFGAPNSYEVIYKKFFIIYYNM